MKRLSIIVPIYKVEPFVERCLSSLLSQNIPPSDYEIICINDGSPDNSRQIILRLQAAYSNIILIDKQNEGVSRARNDGIGIATGKYVLFIDPDDYINHNCLKGILDKADNLNAQVSFLGFSLVSELEFSEPNHIRFQDEGRIYTGIEAYFKARGNGLVDPDRMVGVLFDRHFLEVNDLRYLSDVPFLEDGEFIARILTLTKRCIFDTTPFYIRTFRIGSATNSNLIYTLRATKGFVKAAINLKQFQLNVNLDDSQKNFINQPIIKFVVLSLLSCRKTNTFRRILMVKRELSENGLAKCNLNGSNRTYKRYGIAYNINPILVLILGIYSEILIYFKRKLFRS